MKIILEYKNGVSFWKSFSTVMKIVDSHRIEENVFGYYHWPDGAINGYDEGIKFIESPYTINARNLFPETVSYATLNELFEYTPLNYNTDGIPVSSRELKVDLKNVAYLSIPEYETCIQGTKCVVDYEALLAAAKYIQSQGNEVRFFIFK